MSQDELQGEAAGSVCPVFQRGPTPFALDNAQIIHASIPTLHQVQTTRNGTLNFSGRSQRKGAERNQKMTNPTNSYVVVGMSGPNLFSIRAKEGHIAVIQTAQSLPPFQPEVIVNAYEHSVASRYVR